MRDWIYSMSNLSKRGSGLPVNLWLDEGKTYVKGKHSKRVKFQLDYGNKISKNYASMTLDGEVVDDTFDERLSELKLKDIRQVSTFVKNNSYALNHLSDNDITTYDFFEIMIKGGEPATLEQLNELKKKVDDLILNEEDNVLEIN